MSTIDWTDAEVSGWAVGLAAFAGAIMVLIGIFQAFAGLAAIFEDDSSSSHRTTSTTST